MDNPNPNPAERKRNFIEKLRNSIDASRNPPPYQSCASSSTEVDKELGVSTKLSTGSSPQNINILAAVSESVSLLTEFSDVKCLREMLKAYGKSRLSPRSEKEYQKKCKTMDAWRPTQSEPPELTKHCGSQRSFNAYRAAFIWGAVQRGALALRTRDKWPKGTRERQAAVEEMRCAIKDLQRYPMVRQGTDLARRQQQQLMYEHGLDEPPPVGEFRQAQVKGTTPKKKHHEGKALATNRLNKKRPMWRSELFGHLVDIESPWKIWAAIQSLTGCRPVEISKTYIRLEADGRIGFRIEGAKCDETKGQPMRILTLHEDCPEFDFLKDLLKEQGHTLNFAFQKMGKALKDPVAAYESALRRAGKTMFGKSAKFSAYCYRHALAADLKADGLARETLAGILGHAVTETASVYGRCSGGLKHIRAIDVSIARSVRVNHERDFQGLRADRAPTTPMPEPEVVSPTNSVPAVSAPLSFPHLRPRW